MNYTTNFNLRLPERNEQFNLDDWNNNTTNIDSAMQTNKTNISNNATNITSILNGLSTVNTSDTSSIYYKLMKLIYPVGSLYWSSKSTNPASLFGGTWVQIKDRFVLACGDTYTSSGATGGASSVTLSVSNMPSHNHSFTPSGTVSSHSHTINSGNTSSSGTTNTAGIRFISTNTNSSGEHTHLMPVTTSSPGSGTSSNFYNFSTTSSVGTQNSSANSGFAKGSSYKLPATSSGILASVFGTGLDFRQTSFYSEAGGTSLSGTHTHRVTASGYIYGKTYATNPTFTGLAGTTSSNGSGTSFNILPPYVVKYCFERTA